MHVDVNLTWPSDQDSSPAAASTYRDLILTLSTMLISNLKPQMRSHDSIPKTKTKPIWRRAIASARQQFRSHGHSETMNICNEDRVRSMIITESTTDKSMYDLQTLVNCIGAQNHSILCRTVATQVSHGSSVMVI